MSILEKTELKKKELEKKGEKFDLNYKKWEFGYVPKPDSSKLDQFKEFL